MAARPQMAAGVGQMVDDPLCGVAPRLVARTRVVGRTELAAESPAVRASPIVVGATAAADSVLPGSPPAMDRAASRLRGSRMSRLHDISPYPHDFGTNGRTTGDHP